ncbi:hypothetical protein CDEST_02474 [Colletotrichum destructivum]|uniref:Secreted protein n=1 Tax=Colletotrichum destructivum TaxID=34406 RepID=A0AAX4I393_9PEZI|nr:hypothetical protein CDEST_02474 [Colletotrichum destructivum]
MICCLCFLVFPPLLPLQTTPCSSFSSSTSDGKSKVCDGGLGWGDYKTGINLCWNTRQGLKQLRSIGSNEGKGSKGRKLSWG